MFNVDNTDREVHDFTFLCQLSSGEGKGIKEIEIVDEGGDVVAYDTKGSSMSTHRDTADGIVKYLVVKAWEKLGEKEKAGEVEDTWIPTVDDIPHTMVILGDSTKVAFVKNLTNRIVEVLTKNESRLYRARPGYTLAEMQKLEFWSTKEQQDYIRKKRGEPDHLILSWHKEDLTDVTAEIKFSKEGQGGDKIVPMEPRYEGEDWSEVGRFPTYTELDLIDSVGVMYSGRPHQLLIQLIDWDPKAVDNEGKPRGFKYTDARLYYTTREGKLLSCLMHRCSTCWKLKEVSTHDAEDYNEILKQSNYTSAEVSYLLEAHVRHQVHHCDMPLRNWGKDDEKSDSFYVHSGELAFGDPTDFYLSRLVCTPETMRRPTFGVGSIIEGVAKGNWISEVVYQYDTGKPMLFKVAHEDYWDGLDDLPVSHQVEGLSGEVVLNSEFMVGDYESLSERWGDKDEFLPMVKFFTSKKFIRPYRGNYLGAGIVIATQYNKETTTQVSIYTATEGEKKGEVVALICEL